MNRLLIGLLVLALVVAGGIVAGQQAFSQQDSDSAPAVIVPGTPIAEPGDFPTVAVPETDPLSRNKPAAQPALANETVLGTFTFESEDLTHWDFGQIVADVIDPAPWYVEDGHLRAPINQDSFDLFNDSLALAPLLVSGNYAIEASGVVRFNSKLGLVIGYQDDDNHVSLVFNTANAAGYDRSGLALVQTVDGERTVLAVDETMVAQDNVWYRLRLDIEGTTVYASIDNAPLLEGELVAPLAGERVGVYGGHEGGAYLDDIRVVEVGQ